MTEPVPKTAVLYRMVMGHHICPWGLRSKDLLRRRGYAVEDRWLTTREETDAFKAEHGVKTTPQTFIGGTRIGGYDDLRRHFGIPVRDPQAVTLRPVAAVFALTALMALAASHAASGDAFTPQALQWFVAFSMVVLATLKLQNVERFATMFLGYDLLARRWPPYGYLYPFAEAAAGLLMVAGLLPWISIPVALFIGGIGAVSVFKAVYIDRRELKCACVGGDSNVPLGFVSLTENLMMVAMALWMLAMPPLPAGGMRHGDSPSSHAYMVGMEKMSRDMNASMSGDADKDFVSMMIPHHQGAIDMAKVELEHGKDPELHRLSREIIAAQEKEIAQMNGWQARFQAK